MLNSRSTLIPLLEWSYLRAVNGAISRGAPPSQMENFLGKSSL